MTKRLLASILVCSAALFAQPVIAPSISGAGTERGQNNGGYNFTNSFETGVRFHTVGGNEGKYRSDVNFGNGLRLLGGNLAIRSREGHGAYFDELLLNTVGLGSDPYQMASFRIQKNGLYRYDMLWRQNDYFNPALSIANGQHLINTTHGLQDHNLVLLPQSPFRLLLGYSHSSQSGPALSTVQQFDIRGDEFPLLSNIRRQQNEYRLGGEAEIAGFRLTLVKSWEYFKEDSEERLTAVSVGNNSADSTTLQSFRRAQPYHGSTGTYRVHLLTTRAKAWSLNGRFAYAGGQRNFFFDESALGTDRFGGNRSRQILVSGLARRPVTSASLTGSWFASDKLTITNHTSFHNTRMDGDGSFREITPLFTTALVNFQFLGIRTFSNATDVNYSATNRVGFFAGYQYSTRNIRSIEQTTFEGEGDPERGEQDNTLHAGRFGVKLRPIKPLSIIVDAEVGRADRPFFPTSEKNYEVFGGRVQYRTRTLSLGVLAKTNYNTNAYSLANHSSKSRNYSADASWTPLSWFGFDASYSRMHLDTVSALAYFVTGNLVNDRSVYVSNIHAGSIGARVGIQKRADLMVGYTRVQDTGGNGPLNTSPFGFQSYPLSFDSPYARISVILTKRFRWNAGYQHYGYADETLRVQDYRAHTGFTSLSWSF